MRSTDHENDMSEAAIFGRLFEVAGSALPPAFARRLLALDFPEADKVRMHELAVRNQEGKLTAAERETLLNYVKVGDLLAIVQSKARQALKKAKVRSAVHG
jgi:hypothetical protein